MAFGSNKGVVKNDINFFAAFTASARKQAQALAIVAIVALVAVGITLVVLGYQGYRWFNLNNSVNDLKKELAKPEYAELDAQARDLQAEIVSKSQYFYTLSQMRMAVDEVQPAPVALCDVLGDNVPNDTFIQTYIFTGEEAQIVGYTYNYYSALEMMNRIQSRDVFVAPDIEIVRTELVPGNQDFVEGVQYFDACYMFTITGNLTSDVYVSFSSYLDDGVTVSALTGVQTQALKPGSDYRFEYIATYDDYVLTKVKIDGVEVSPETLQAFIDADAVSGTAQRNIVIECYYSPVVEETAEGGEA